MGLGLGLGLGFGLAHLSGWSGVSSSPPAKTRCTCDLGSSQGRALPIPRRPRQTGGCAMPPTRPSLSASLCAASVPPPRRLRAASAPPLGCVSAASRLSLGALSSTPFLWGDMGRYGKMWGDMGRYGEMSLVQHALPLRVERAVCALLAAAAPVEVHPPQHPQHVHQSRVGHRKPAAGAAAGAAAAAAAGAAASASAAAAAVRLPSRGARVVHARRDVRLCDTSRTRPRHVEDTSGTRPGHVRGHCRVGGVGRLLAVRVEGAEGGHLQHVRPGLIN